ncbi:MAG: single-stranded DNA-binding protein [Actinobacteria bacterium]|nr:single-stranded DNA-binding protein [Actinomycetota bacterium]
MAGDINRVTLVGRLTRDPELRHLPSGSPVLQLGLAVNGRQKDEGGNWVDKPNFFDVKVFGNQAEMLSMHLSKGRRVGIDGRLDWSSWEAQDGSKRSKVEVVAFQVQFLDSRGEGGEAAPQYVPAGDVRADQSDFGPSAADDDIPF